MKKFTTAVRDLKLKFCWISGKEGLKMKSKILVFSLALMLLTSTGLIFAKTNEKSLKGLPYEKGLGYKVNLDTGNQDVEPLNYDSGWKSFLGGKWRHGVGDYYVWSHYDHKRKTHRTTVQGAGGERSTSGWIKKKIRASASWERALWGKDRKSHV